MELAEAANKKARRKKDTKDKKRGMGTIMKVVTNKKHVDMMKTMMNMKMRYPILQALKSVEQPGIWFS